MSWSRRRLLQSLGLLPLVPGIARGAATPPMRVLFYVTSHGTVYDNWKLRVPGLTEDADWELDLPSLAPGAWSPILAPLRDHADKLLVLDGIGSPCAMAAGFNEHRAGNGACLTGRVPIEISEDRAECDGPSIDQAIAATRATPFRSLEYAVGGAPVAYDEVGDPIPHEADPQAAWARLFPAAAEADTVAGRVSARQQSILDVAAGRFDALATRLAPEDRERIELHRELVVDLERRLGLVAALNCEPAVRPGDAPDTNDATYPDHMVDAFHDLTTVALACGLTEVATLRMDHIPPATIGAPPGDLHADVAHAVADNDYAAQLMTDYHAWHARRFGDLLARLDGIPDGDGTLLDHTLVVWHNEMGTGDHLFGTVPVVLAGATGWLRTGRVVRWAPRHEVQGLYVSEAFGQPLQRLLATIGAAAGLPIDGFGVEQLTATDGSVVDCTGLLDRVR